MATEAATTTAALTTDGAEGTPRAADAPETTPTRTPPEGAFTAVPRWAASPRPGTAERTVVLPDALAADLDRRAAELGVPAGSILLAAHAKVLAVLSGDPAVRTGYLPAGPVDGPSQAPEADTAVVAVEITVAPGTWRQLIAAASRAEAAALAHPVPVPQAQGPDVVCDPTGHGRAVLGDRTVLGVAAGEAGGRRVLRLHHRTDALDDACAERIAGYHLTALAGIAADPDAPHDRTTLVSDAELGFQLRELAGPTRELPDRRFHELFEERARRNPDAVAVAHGDLRWTYGELGLRANRLANALLADGVRGEDVVAVVTERNLNWAVAVLAVLKAGAVYLPVDPHHPARRMTAVLTRADCRHVLTEPGSTGNLDEALAALPGTRRMSVPDLADRAGDGSAPGVEVAADRLAYLFFTSGSTGEPKGALCEHAGLLNHLLAKIEDLGIGEGTVVAQTASQCFDISLWQLLAPLLTGGRTHLVEQSAILDADRFLDTVTEAGVNVLQVVPSYLDVLLTELEARPRALPDLRCVSVTGEALKSGLVRRWFTGGPGVRLVNAYGLTETSDDTNHEVLDRAPAASVVPLGRPVRNVRLYVVDDRLVPVPLGAPGAIVFSGVCVGRGYVNDPERTRAAYRSDPYHPGQRLYEGGDFGRWLPDGKLEFLGRKDAQTKIRGFRVEIGEIENTLLRVPGVRDGAVVVTGPEGHGRELTAFATGDRATVTPRFLRERLTELLPAYMVPTSLHRLESLPLTANGKTDRKALVALAEDLAHTDDDVRPPRTPTERRLAAAWATALGVPAERIGRDDDFYRLGGTSLSAVRLAVALDRAITPRDLTAHPTLAALAGLIDARTGTAPT